MQVGKGSAMKHYNSFTIQLPHARPTMHCIPLVGASAASPTLVVKTENCLYIYIYIYGTYVFRICILPYLCAMQYFHIAH